MSPSLPDCVCVVFCQMSCSLSLVSFLCHPYDVLVLATPTSVFSASQQPAQGPTCARAPPGALGSPGFVAPEVVLDAPHAPSMDVFSLGVVLFIMLVGRKPFNIADSESLAYVHLELAKAPGLRDQRCGGHHG